MKAKQEEEVTKANAHKAKEAAEENDYDMNEDENSSTESNDVIFKHQEGIYDKHDRIGFELLQKKYEEISLNTWTFKKFGRSPCYALLLGCMVRHSIKGMKPKGHAYRDTLRAIELEKDGFVIKSVAKEANMDIPDWHLSKDFTADDFVDAIRRAFGTVVFMYIAFDYLNSPHCWIRDNWGPGAIKNLQRMAERGYLQTGSIVELPYTVDVQD